MTITDISVPGLNAIRMEEGRALRAYQDAVHVWTVGYGLTNYDKGLPWKVGPGLVITEAEAEWYLYHSLRTNYLPDVERALNFDKCPHPQGACDAGCGFHYNCGGIRRATWPALLMQGNMQAARVSLESWCRAGGRVLQDLVRRRAHEWAMISAADYGHLTGPVVVVPGANNQETYRGTGDLLTALPTPPSSVGTAPPVTDHASVPQPTTPNPGVLKNGSTGPAVTELQTKLGVPATGTFDDATEAAVRKFQSAHPYLTNDGEVGPATSAALARDTQLKTTVTTITKTLPAGGGVFVGLHQWVSAHGADIALVAGGLVLVGIVAYVVWNYRHDIMQKANAAVGRVVP
jgi:lysozyme